jgi:hypothetical protein
VGVGESSSDEANSIQAVSPELKPVKDLAQASTSTGKVFQVKQEVIIVSDDEVHEIKAEPRDIHTRRSHRASIGNPRMEQDMAVWNRLTQPADGVALQHGTGTSNNNSEAISAKSGVTIRFMTNDDRGLHQRPWAKCNTMGAFLIQALKGGIFKSIDNHVLMRASAGTRSIDLVKDDEDDFQDLCDLVTNLETNIESGSATTTSIEVRLLADRMNT